MKMKWIITVLAVAAATLGSGWRERPRADASGPTQHRVVFELTSDDAQAWNGVLNNVENLQKALGTNAIEVVAHGKGLSMLTAAKSAPVRDRMQRIADAGIVFAACENTMQREGVKREDLVPFATTVDSGVAEVVRKQEDGWSYVRSGS